MKTLVTSLFALTASLALAQQKNSISRSINDDGKTLSIRVNGTMDGKPIDYDRTFDVSRLNRDERNALREHILDSLNVGMPEPPKRPIAPRAALAPREPRAPTPPTPPEPMTIISSDQSIVSVSSGDNQAVAVGGKNPYTKEVKYNSESGQLFLRYRFKKDGEEFTYERKVDAHDKSQQERQQIIDGIEKEIGVPKNSK
ncbi:hypothetical protein [Spirosoma endbachense]|uniref:Uncharacterized protein n=1 Tax=Spirosoma endbachense TaxID=2666025 RepID=A0A6P1VN34_9BACT|nr:hypothetical protein [Spirosoma endbachense]QHV94493.1 hypothetical protein GJR95_05465 [Spirosoma endbachense]